MCMCLWDTFFAFLRIFHSSKEHFWVTRKVIEYIYNQKIHKNDEKTNEGTTYAYVLMIFTCFFRNFWSVWASTCIDVYVYTWHRCFFLRIFHSSTAHFWVYFQVLERSLGTFSIKKYTKTTKLNKTTAITVNAYVLKVFTWFYRNFLIIMSVIVGWRRKSWYPASILVRVKAKILIQ